MLIKTMVTKGIKYVRTINAMLNHLSASSPQFIVQTFASTKSNFILKFNHSKYEMMFYSDFQTLWWSINLRFWAYDGWGCHSNTDAPGEEYYQSYCFSTEFRSQRIDYGKIPGKNEYSLITKYIFTNASVTKWLLVVILKGHFYRTIYFLLFVSNSVVQSLGFFLYVERLVVKSSAFFLYTVFENHRKSIIKHCERSELHLHFEWTKVH